MTSKYEFCRFSIPCLTPMCCWFLCYMTKVCSVFRWGPPLGFYSLNAFLRVQLWRVKGVRTRSFS